MVFLRMLARLIDWIGWFILFNNQGDISTLMSWWSSRSSSRECRMYLSFPGSEWITSLYCEHIKHTSIDRLRLRVYCYLSFITFYFISLNCSLHLVLICNHYNLFYLNLNSLQISICFLFFIFINQIDILYINIYLSIFINV